MNKYIIKILSVILCAVLAAVLIIALRFAVPCISSVPETEGEITYRVSYGDNQFGQETVVIGEDVAAVRITDIVGLGRITRVNYVPDKFVNPSSPVKGMTVVDLTKPFEFAEKGTLMFVIMNVDPYSENFDELSEELSQFRIGDYWHFTISLPAVLCASNVYDNAALNSANGEIENYEFIDFTTTYDKVTDKFSPLTQRTNLDLQFYTRRQAMNLYRVITVHYQSTGSAYSGMRDCPLIGTEQAVKKATESSQAILLSFAIISTVVFAVFCVLSILEQTKEFVPTVVSVFGIALMLFSNFLFGQASGVPLLWSAVKLCSSFIVLGGALLSMGKNYKKIPLKYIFPALMTVGALLAFIRPYVPFSAEFALNIVCTVIKAIGVALLFAFITLETVSKNKWDIPKILCAVLIAVAVSASFFLPSVFPAQNNSMFWLCVITTAMTFVSMFTLFIQTKKANDYLTANLHLEVERQLKDIKSIIEERDNLLQFVSHDMKKPLQTSAALVDTLIERESDGEQKKALKIVKQHTERVVTNLSEIGAYAKFNYIAEPSQVVDLKELCSVLCKYHGLDCDANGIVLKNSVSGSYKVFAKSQGLENAASNIIMNAVEHSACKTITLSVKRNKNKAVLCIADDGKGISSDIDIFKPYVSENKPQTGGIGLFICKSIIESMNGELTCESRQGSTVFKISLLKA